MNDDWRLQVDLHDRDDVGALVERLDALELEHDLSNAFSDRVIVSRDGDRLFLYAGSREQAERARSLLGSLAERHGWNVDIELKRWHPAAEEWEDPDRPLPADREEVAAEREELMSAERQETLERGWPEFEVRVDLPSRHDAAALADRLEREGLPTVHRFRFLLVGAADEDAARQLAERIESEAPAGSRVRVEGTWAAVRAEQPRNPFAVLGGFGA